MSDKLYIKHAGGFKIHCTDLHVIVNSTLTLMKSWERLSDLTLLQGALGSSCCRTISCLMWPECVGSSWMTKSLMPMSGPLVPLT